MKHWFKSVCSIVAVLAFAVAASAGMMSVTGQVTEYEAGKTISVKDDKGKVHALEMTKETKVEGDVRVGAKVSVHSDGKTAQTVKGAAGG